MKGPKNVSPSAPEVLRRRYRKSILLLGVLALLLAAAVNGLMAQLPMRYTHFDTTDVQLYSISDHTKQLLSSLDTDIQLYLVAQYGSEDSITRELLDRYADLSRHIQVQQIDPLLRPDLLERYSSSMAANSVIVASADRFRVIAPTELYVENAYYAEDGSYSYDSYFAGEQEVTSAISYVTSDFLPKLYTLSGHGEAELPHYIQEAITRENIQLDTLNLSAREAVPEDADILLLYAPEKDLLEEEVRLLLSYLQGGGRMLIIGGSFTQPAPNFDTLTAYYGAERVEGTVVERNSNYYLDQYPAYVLANIASHDITKPLVNRGYFVLSPMSQGLVPMDSVRDTVISSPLLYSTDSSLSVYSADAEGDAATLGPFTLGLAIQEEVSGSTTRLVWYTSPYLLENVDTLALEANYDLFLNSLSWLYNFDNGIFIRTKTLMMDYLTIRPSVGTALGAGMIVLIPTAVLAVGGITLSRRRRH